MLDKPTTRHATDPSAPTRVMPRRPSRDATHPRSVLIILAIVTLVLVVGPLIVLVHVSLLPADTLPLSAGHLTLANYRDAFLAPDTLLLLRNTIAYAGGTVTLALLLAAGIAWLTERTDLPGRGWIHTMMFSSMAIPPFVVAFGWILLLNPNNGALNLALMYLFSLQRPPLTIYSLWVMILISGLSLAPTIFVMLANLLRNMDPRLESAASASGATRLTVLRRITLPLLSPGVLSIAIYMFMVMVQAFDVPLAIGLTARVPMLSVRIYMLASGSDELPRYGIAAALGVVLMGFAVVLMRAFFRLERRGERFRVVTGKAFHPRIHTLGRSRWGAVMAVGLYFAVMLLPLLMLLWTSLQPYYRAPSIAALGSLTLAHYYEVLAQPLFHQAVLNTAILALASASCVMTLACLISWYSVRTSWRLARWLDMLAFLPIAVPHIVMAVAIMVLYLRTPLYGTLALLILAHTGSYIAFGTRTMNAALLQIHRELEDAAAASGARWTTTIRRIILPLLWPHFLNGWLWVVAHSARDLTIPLMLLSTGNLVIASLLWLTWERPDVPGAAAYAMVLVAALVAVVIAVRRLNTAEGGRHGRPI
ncbi:MAG: ABC transporter permease [Acetobacteraceae bacterium]